MRWLLSAMPLAISQVSLFGQSEVRINSIWGNDRITLRQGTDGLVVGNTGGWTTTVPGTFDKVFVRGGRGNDSILVDSSVHTDCMLYGGSGRNTLQAGSGNDTLVSLGSAADTLIGGAGRDSFWTDNSPRERIVNLRADEFARGSIHRVGIVNGILPNARMPVRRTSAPQVSQPLAQPGDTYVNFPDHPLFSSHGPSPNDVFQGGIGDCYFLATLAAVAKTDPWRIRQSILDMGDGTFLVQFSRGTGKSYIRVDDRLATLPGGSLAYANFGAGGGMWVAVMEKAYAVFHGPTPMYASIDGGWMNDAFSALGAAPLANPNPSSPGALLMMIQQDLEAGQAVTFATDMTADSAPLLDQHAYSIDHVEFDAQGMPTGLTLRNPWGVDGAGNDGNPNDGYVTVTGRQAYDSWLGVVSATV